MSRSILRHTKVEEVEHCHSDSAPYRYRVILKSGWRWSGYRSIGRSFLNVREFYEAAKYSIEAGEPE